MEVETAPGRIAYGPVGRRRGRPVRRGLPAGGAPSLCLGPTEEIPFLKQQERLTFARCGVIDPLSLADYEAHGGYAGLRRALGMQPAEIVEESCRLRPARPRRRRLPHRHQVADRAGRARRPEVHRLQRRRGRQRHLRRPDAPGGRPVLPDRGHDYRGAGRRRDPGYVYLRSEYPHAFAHAAPRYRASAGGGLPRRAFAAAAPPSTSRCASGPGPTSAAKRRRCWRAWRASAAHPLQAAPPGHRRPLRQADRGQQRPVAGHACRSIMAARRASSTPARHGTLPGHACRSSWRATSAGRHRGDRLRYHAARADLRLRRRHRSGPAGARGAGRRAAGRLLPDRSSTCRWTTRRSRRQGHARARRHRGLRRYRGHGAQARFAMEFCAIECCGKCTPCRIGSTRGVEVIDKIIAGGDRAANLELLDDLCEVMTDGSLCAMGGLTPFPVSERPAPLPGRLRPARHTQATADYEREVAPMTPLHEIDYGTPARVSETQVTLEIDGKPVSVPAGTSVMRAATRPASTCRSCAPPTTWSLSDPAASAWSRSTGGAARPRPAPRRSRPA